MSSERGSLSAFVAIIAIFFVAISVTLADGARRLSNISRAEDLASEAARAAAATLDVGDLASGRATIDVHDDDSGAEAQAARILAASGDDVDFQVVVGDDRRTVRVDVIVNGTSLLPGFDIRGYGSHTARVIEPNEVS